MPDYITAVNDMFAHVKASWELSAVQVYGDLIELRYQGVEADKIPDVMKPWGRVTVRTGTYKRACVGMLGNSGAIRHRSSGVLQVEIWAPKTVAGSFNKAQSLAGKLKNQLLGMRTANGVELHEAGIDDFYYMDLQWYRVAVVAKYQFDEIV